ncbi:uncharacterized protein [Branchiostoma lanceolatum]|uniref:uncharacterized protein n=1 Tax=Branchiostoma lanceolatum TaxID=7740 RepID=UPI0034568201
MLVLLLLLLDPAQARDSRQDFCKELCAEPGRICGLGTSGNCTELCLRYPSSGECMAWPFDMLPEYESVPGPRNLVVTPLDGNTNGLDAINITWQPSGDAIRCLKGFTVLVVEMSPASSSICHQIILGFNVTLTHEDNQKKFSLTVRDLRPGTSYGITVRSLSSRRPSDGDDDSVLIQKYRTRPCESIPGCKTKPGPSRWNPPQPTVTSVGRTVTIRAWTARQFNIRTYNLYLGKPTGNIPYPNIISMTQKNLSLKDSTRKYFQHTFSDIPPGQYTLQYSVDARDPYRSYPVPFTVTDWTPDDMSVQQSCRNVTVEFEGPTREYNLSTCNVTLTRKSYPERTWTRSVILEKNVSVVFANLKPDIYAVKVASPFPDAFPVKEKIIEVTDWVPRKQDINVKAKSVNVRVVRGRSGGRSRGRKKQEARVRLTFPRPEPRLKYGYSGFYLYYGKDPSSMERQTVPRPVRENWNNVTVVLKDMPAGIQFFQVSAPYDDAQRSELLMSRVLRRSRGRKNRNNRRRRRKQQRNRSEGGNEIAK